MKLVVATHLWSDSGMCKALQGEYFVHALAQAARRGLVIPLQKSGQLFEPLLASSPVSRSTPPASGSALAHDAAWAAHRTRRALYECRTAAPAVPYRPIPLRSSASTKFTL